MTDKIYKSVLCRKGYILDKSQFDPKIIEKIKEELTVKPQLQDNYSKEEAQPFPVYIENSKKISIPKYYGLQKLGKPELIVEDEDVNIDLNFSGSMRPHQIKVLDSIVPLIFGGGGGLISLPCGFGKTDMALYIITNILKKKALIIVHKTFLMNQWKERIAKYYPNAKVGTIIQDKVDVEGKDIVIGMLQSISMKSYDISIFQDFGTTVIDECHHIPSRVFSRALTKINSKYMIGLSATPYRKDKLEKIIDWFIGPMLVRIEKRNTISSAIRLYNYTSTNKLYKRVIGKDGKEISAIMLNNIVQVHERNDFIHRIIKDILKKEPLRQVMFLSDRKEHLETIKELIDNDKDMKEFTTGYYVGGMSKTKLKESESKTVIFGTYAMASEGLDIPTLDTIVMGTPRTSIEQTIGRIVRKDNPDEYINQPLVIDIADNLGTYKFWTNARKKIYKNLNYEVTEYNVNDIYDHITFKGIIPQDPNFEAKQLQKSQKKAKQTKKVLNGITIKKEEINDDFLDDE